MAAAGAAIPVATAIAEATNATGTYGSGASVDWGIGATTFQEFVDDQANFNGLAVIGGSGSQLHFDNPMAPFLTVTTGTLVQGDKVIDVAGGSAWDSANYAFNGVAKTLTISGPITSGSTGAGDVTILNGGIISVNQTGSTNFYQSVDSTTIQAGGKLTSNGNSILRNLTLSGGVLASSGTDAISGGWTLSTPTTVTGGVSSTISARDVNLTDGNITVDAGSSLDFSGSIKSGSLIKNGDGTMKMSSNGVGGTPVNAYSGGTIINSGILEIHGSTDYNGGFPSLGFGDVTINDGGTLVSAVEWTTGNEWTTGSVGLITINNGGTWTINGVGNTVRNGLVLNGGTVNGTGSNADWGGMYLRDTSVTASGNATSNISVDTAMNAITTMQVDSGSTLNFSGNLHNSYSGTGGINKTGDGALSLSGENTYNGSTFAKEGSLIIASANALQNSTLELSSGDTGTVTFNQNSTLGGLSGSRNLDMGGNALSIGNNGSSTTYEGALSNGSLNKIGAGTLTLSGTNTYAGGTTVTAGSLLFTNLAAKPAAGQTTVAAGSMLVLGTGGAGYFSSSDVAALFANTMENVTMSSTANVGIDTTAGDFTYSDSIASTTMGLTKLGNNKLTLTGTNSYTGATTVSAGTLFISGSGALPSESAVAIQPGAVLELNEGTANRTWTAGISGQGTLVKAGIGTLTFSSAYNKSGATTISEGTLVLQDTYGANSQFDIASGAVLELNVASGLRDLGDTSFNGTGTLRKTGDGGVFWGSSTAVFNLRAGALIDVQDGNITVGSNMNEHWTTSMADLNVAAGASFNTVEANVRLDKITGSGIIGTGLPVWFGYESLTVGVNNGSSTFDGVIQNTEESPTWHGNVVKTGTGTFTLSGTNTYTGTTTVSAGALIVNGSISTSVTTVQSGATIGGDGEVGALTVEAGGFVAPGNSPGVLDTGNYDQAGTLVLEINGATAGQYDQLNVAGTVTLSGNLSTSLGSGYTPANGDLLFILLNDDTDAINGTFSGLADNTTFTQNGQDWQISYHADSGSGDFDSLTGNDVALRAIPEPGAALLGGLGLLALLRRRR